MPTPQQPNTTKKNLLGFTVNISPQSLNSPYYEKTYKELLKQLSKIKTTLPKNKITSLKKHPIWINDHGKSAMYTHYSRKWLTKHNQNPDMAGGIEIANMKHFTNWTKLMPWAVLHEYAHIYHYFYLNPLQKKQIKTSYNKAKTEGLYRKVSYTNTKNKYDAYALTNEMEYFAEISEAYWGKNDYFPQKRNALSQYDPTGYQTVKTSWNLKPQLQKNIAQRFINEHKRSATAIPQWAQTTK